MRNKVCKTLRNEALDYGAANGWPVLAYDGEEKAPQYIPQYAGGLLVGSFKASKGIPRYMTECSRAFYKELKRGHHEAF